MKRHTFFAAIVALSFLVACGDGVPRITSVEPKEVKSGVTGMIDIKGSGFKPGAVVKIGGIPALQTVVAGPKEVVAMLPRNLPAGPVAVVVENPDGIKAELASGLKVLTGLQIAGLDPESVNQGEDSTVQISGTGFVAGTKAFINELPAVVEIKSDRLLVATVPALPAGLATIRLEAPDGGRAELVSGFQVLGADQIKNVRPLRDESVALGLDAATMSSRTGAAVADLNGDGWLDLAITDPYSAHIMLGGKDGFKDVSAESGIKDLGITYGAYPADFDNDGLPDLMITGQQGKLFHNLGGGKFENVTARVGLPTNFMSWSAAWTDYDGDGLVDLYLGAPGSEDKLFRNRGGRFEEVFADRWQKMTNATKVNNRQPSTFSVAFGDIDNDGFSELIAGVRGQESRFYRNLGGKDFVFSNSAFGLNFARATIFKINWGLSFVDYDNDGFLDLFSASGPTGADLYRNIDGKRFTNVTPGMGVRFTDSPLCPAWGDVDNDGLLDLALSDNENGVFVYRNRGDGSFEEIHADLKIPDGNELAAPMAIVWFDYNGDGALDLYCTGFGQPNRMLVNTPYPDRHYLEVRLEGAKSNRMGIGAMVILEAQGRKQTQQVTSGSGYLMSPSPVLHFGLDQATVIDKITVRWPGGSIQTLEHVSADQILTITEPGERVKITLPPPVETPAPTAPAATEGKPTSGAPATPAPAAPTVPAKPAQ